jgi:hypothetical protein
MDWYIKGRIIVYRPSGEQTIEIVQRSNERFLKLLDKGNESVHIFLDARYITKVPTSLLKLSNATSFLRHPSIGWVITISNNALIIFLGGMLPQLGYLTRYKVVSKPNDGLTFLKEQDPTLDWSKANHQLIEE